MLRKLGFFFSKINVRQNNFFFSWSFHKICRGFFAGIVSPHLQLQRQTHSCPRAWHLWVPWGPRESPSESPRTSQHWYIEGFKRAHLLETHYTKKREPLGQQMRFLSSLGWQIITKVWLKLGKWWKIIQKWRTVIIYEIHSKKFKYIDIYNIYIVASLYW